jgi:hypothetical protein
MDGDDDRDVELETLARRELRCDRFVRRRVGHAERDAYVRSIGTVARRHVRLDRRLADER